MKTILLILLTFCTITAFAQKADSLMNIQVDTISYKTVLGTNVYSMYGKKINPRDLQMKFDLNTPELHDMQQARVNSTIAYILSFSAGMLIGYEIGAVARGVDPRNERLLIGLGVLGLSIPFNMAFNKRSLKAVAAYNNKLRQQFK